MITPESLARMLLPQMEKGVDAGDAKIEMFPSDIRSLCMGLIWLAENKYPLDWLSEEAVAARKLVAEEEAKDAQLASRQADLASLSDEDFAAAYSNIMADVRSSGISGFSGECWPMAVAINRVVFGGQATLAAGLNVALIEKAKIPIGHGAIWSRKAYWDVDGQPKDADLVESWGMLAFDDPDNKATFSNNKVRWSQRNADAAAVFGFDSEAEFMQIMKIGNQDVEPFEQALESALARWSPGMKPPSPRTAVASAPGP